MKKHKPDPRQCDLWENRARKFQLLRDFYCLKTPAQKLMLTMLELAIGNFRELRIPMKTLAKRCILSEDSARRVAGELRDLDLIRYIPDSQKRKAPLFSIAWHWVDRLHRQEEGEAEIAVEDGLDEVIEAEPTLKIDEESAEHDDSGSFASKRSAVTGKRTSCVGAVLSFADKRSSFASKRHYMNCDFSSIVSSISSSTSTSSDAFDELVVMVREAGVVQDEPTLRKAISKGLSLDQVRAVVEHFNASPGRWPVGVLVNRLTRDGAARLAPDEGWYGERPEWIAQRKRAAEAAAQAQEKENAMPVQLTREQREAREQMEKLYGPTLDAMTPAELAELVAGDQPTLRMVRRLGKNDRIYRPFLLSKLQAREAAQREQLDRRSRLALDFPPLEDAIEDPEESF